MKVKPLGRRLLIRLDDPPQRSSILVTPSTDADVLRRWGTVIEVGSLVTDYQPGDRVFSSINQAVEVNGDFILPERAIMLRDA